LLKALKKDLRSLKRKYADARRTKIAVKKAKAKTHHKDQESGQAVRSQKSKPE
jgi:DNA gyrase/topoisomerase IV subunit A